MPETKENVLHKILAHKRQEIEQIKKQGLDQWRRQAHAAPAPRDFLAALRASPKVPVIAEIKRRSPTLGDIRPDISLKDQAAAYARAGASAVSVLTDEKFFGGTLQDIIAIRPLVHIPILRKDFILDPIQIYQARAAGADAILLIAAALEKTQLQELYRLAGELNLTALVEVHSPEELESVLDLNPALVGINNRNLQSLKVDLKTSLALRPLIPDEVFVIAESGINTPQDVAALLAGGLKGFLVGTALMRAKDPQAALRSLVEVERP